MISPMVYSKYTLKHFSSRERNSDNSEVEDPRHSENKKPKGATSMVPRVHVSHMYTPLDSFTLRWRCSICCSQAFYLNSSIPHPRTNFEPVDINPQPDKRISEPWHIKYQIAKTRATFRRVWVKEPSQSENGSART